MSPANFREANVVLGPPANHTGPENIVELPVWTDGRECVSLWRLSWKERLAALCFGRLWVRILGGRTQPPLMVEIKKDLFAP